MLQKNEVVLRKILGTHVPNLNLLSPFTRKITTLPYSLLVVANLRSILGCINQLNFINTISDYDWDIPKEGRRLGPAESLPSDIATLLDMINAECQDRMPHLMRARRYVQRHTGPAKAVKLFLKGLDFDIRTYNLEREASSLLKTLGAIRAALGLLRKLQIRGEDGREE